MPDKRSHRGAHPEDERCFQGAQLERVREAVKDFSWLLSRGYADKSALKLVGDRYGLTQRQRMAVMRSGCADDLLNHRLERRVDAKALPDSELLIDGYNVLTTVEAGLAGGVILKGRDGCYRDLASLHGTFRKVAETGPALELIGQSLQKLQLSAFRWYLDRPVSNSGRLKKFIGELAETRGWDWQVVLAQSPDKVLAEADSVVATADSVILDRCSQWFNLAGYVVDEHISQVWLIDLSV